MANKKMSMLDMLCEIAVEKEKDLDEERKKRAAADERRDFVPAICKGKRTRREIEQFLRYGPDHLFSGFCVTNHQGENWSRERELKKPIVGSDEVEKRVERTEIEGTSNGALIIGESSCSDEESCDTDEYYLTERSSSSIKKPKTSSKGISIGEGLIFKKHVEKSKKNKKKEGFGKGLNKATEEEESEDIDSNEHSQRAKRIKKRKVEEEQAEKLILKKPVEKKPEKNKEKNLNNENLDKSNRKRRNDYQGPMPPPGLSMEYKDKIRRKAQEKGKFLEDNKEVLVIQKALEKSDVRRQQNRFSIPIKKMETKFLDDDEAAFLDGKDETGKHYKSKILDIIEPSGQVKTVSLRKWILKKQKKSKEEKSKEEESKKEPKKYSESYILNGDWKHIVPSNKLKRGDIVQLWAARIDGELCFVFVILERSKKEIAPDHSDGGR